MLQLKCPKWHFISAIWMPNVNTDGFTMFYSILSRVEGQCHLQLSKLSLRGFPFSMKLFKWGIPPFSISPSANPPSRQASWASFGCGASQPSWDGPLEMRPICQQSRVDHVPFYTLFACFVTIKPGERFDHIFISPCLKKPIYECNLHSCWY